MNDRFRFRVWQTELQVPKMKYNSGIGFIKNQLDDTDCVIMQCTGLKDKNGKLIYELDYVKYANNKYKVEIDKFLGISLTNILNGDTIVMDDIVLFNCEVIGNEFESNTKI